MRPNFDGPLVTVLTGFHFIYIKQQTTLLIFFSLSSSSKLSAIKNFLFTCTTSHGRTICTTAQWTLKTSTKVAHHHVHPGFWKWRTADQCQVNPAGVSWGSGAFVSKTKHCPYPTETNLLKKYTISADDKCIRWMHNHGSSFCRRIPSTLWIVGRTLGFLNIAPNVLTGQKTAGRTWNFRRTRPRRSDATLT